MEGAAESEHFSNRFWKLRITNWLVISLMMYFHNKNVQGNEIPYLSSIYILFGIRLKITLKETSNLFDFYVRDNKQCRENIAYNNIFLKVFISFQ